MITKRADSFEGVADFVESQISMGNIPNSLVIGFHGYSKSMTTGCRKSFKVIESGENITNYDDELKRLGEALPDSATIILNSCSTGKECKGYNVAEAINKLTGNRVLAPIVDIGMFNAYIDSNRNANVFGFDSVKYFPSEECKLGQLPYKLQWNFFFTFG
ncbi:DUF4347 domain-containing protein [Candidatus Pacearchaeota archaeon]|nr:DUF4347 domain-containing protein [Candidatus Pacearchaeota archaeon]